MTLRNCLIQPKSSSKKAARKQITKRRSKNDTTSDSILDCNGGTDRRPGARAGRRAQGAQAGQEAEEEILHNDACHVGGDFIESLYKVRFRERYKPSNRKVKIP